MNILAVDDERLALEALVDAISKVASDADIFSFRDCSGALDFAKDNHIDVAFLDIEMRGTNGIDFAKKLKIINPKTNIIFVSGYSEYMRDAFSMHASGYLLKPVTSEIVEKELNNLRHPITPPDTNKLIVQTFGNFEVFNKGKVVQFKYSKTKELFAYLIDRKGASCKMGEIIGILWEDRPETKAIHSQLRNLIADLNSTLKEINQDSIIQKHRGSISIVPDKIDCDYYRWLSNDPLSINLYYGEYMTNYSWAESTNASLFE